MGRRDTDLGNHARLILSIIASDYVTMWRTVNIG